MIKSRCLKPGNLGSEETMMMRLLMIKRMCLKSGNSDKLATPESSMYERNKILGGSNIPNRSCLSSSAFSNEDWRGRHVVRIQIV